MRTGAEEVAPDRGPSARSTSAEGTIVIHVDDLVQIVARTPPPMIASLMSYPLRVVGFRYEC